MLLKANEIKDKIAVPLIQRLTADGFSYRKSLNEFKKHNNEDINIFSINQVSWGNHYTLNVNLFITQKRVENVLEKILGKQRHLITMGQDIGRIYKSPDGRKIINGDLSIILIDEKDIEAAIETLINFYEDIAVPYFRRYETLASLDDIFNNAPFNHCPAHVGGNFDERCMKGLIIASLVNNPKYSELEHIYDEEIKETLDNESIKNYYTVRNYLQNQTLG